MFIPMFVGVTFDRVRVALLTVAPAGIPVRSNFKNVR